MVLHQPCSDLAYPHPDRFITSGPRVSNISHIASANGPGSPAGLSLISIHVYAFGQARLCSRAAVWHANGERCWPGGQQDAASTVHGAALVLGQGVSQPSFCWGAAKPRSGNLTFGDCTFEGWWGGFSFDFC